MNKYIQTTKADVREYARKHPTTAKHALIGIEVAAVILLIFLFQAWWRAQNDALRAKKWASQSGVAFAMRFFRDLFIFRFRRDLTAEDLMLHARFFEAKYKLVAHSIRERSWPRWFLVKSFMRIYHESFPRFLSFESCAKYMSQRQLCIGKDGFGKPVLIDTESKIGLITVGGKSGTGKSSLTHAITRQYETGHITVIGGKRGSYPGANWTGAGTSKEEVHALHDALASIETEVKERYELLAKNDVDSVSRASEEVRSALPRKLVILEEADSFLRLSIYPKELRAIGESIIAKARFIIKNGRGANFLTVLVNQTLQKQELDVNLRECGVVLSAETDTAELSISLFGSDIAFSKSLRNGVFVIHDDFGIRRFKAISPEDRRGK